MKKIRDLIVKSSNKQYLYDIINDKYLDFCLGSGTLILGHGHRIFKKEIKSQLNLGSIYSENNIYKINFEKNLRSTFKIFSKYIFCNSGSEANIRAIRISRAISQKKKIAIMSGDWHGSVDTLMFDLNNKKLESLSSGINIYKKDIIVLPKDNIQLCKKILDNNFEDISIIMVEPIQAGDPNNNHIKIIKFLNKYCKTRKIIFHLDECITGLRVKNLSIFKKYNLKPDIVTLGKCFGGGLPIGIVAYSKKIEKKLDSLKLKVFFGGTFSGNPLTMRVGNQIFNFLKTKHRIINQKINNLSYKLENKINQFCLSKNIAFKLLRYESILRPWYKNHKKNHKFSSKFFLKSDINNFRNFLLNNNIFISKNCCFFISQCHTPKDVNYLSSIIIQYLKKNFIKLSS